MSTRMVGHTFRGLDCPKSISYNLSHGPNANVCNTTFKILNSNIGLNNFINLAASPSIGSPCHVRLDRSNFFGFVVRIDNEMSDDDGEETINITAIDWRDRLKDDFIFAAFNMIDESGITWHMLPNEWDAQRKRVIRRELEQVDFDSIQDLIPSSGSIEPASNQTLLSMSTILNILSLEFNFSWTSDNTVRQQLRKIKPLNLDWQSGMTAADAIEQLLSKGQMNWTSIGMNRIRITKKGVASTFTIEQFLNYNITMCDIDGGKAHRASRGKEINDHGRTVLLVGDRNSYQYTYPLVPDWNLKWIKDIAIGQYAFFAFLDTLGLSLNDKLKDMPVEWQDSTPVLNDPAFRTRNEMTIQSYLQDIVYKSYRIDFGTIIDNLVPNSDRFDNTVGRYKTINKETLEVDNSGPSGNLSSYYGWLNPPSIEGCASYFPLSSGLVDNTNYRFLLYSTQFVELEGFQNLLLYSKYLVPGNEGVNIENYEIIDYLSGKNSFYVRLIFSEYKCDINQIMNFQDPGEFIPDRMAVTIAVDREVFTHKKGGSNGIKSRVNKQQVSKLRKGFINGQEQVILARNLQIDLHNGGAVPATLPIITSELADEIADSYLYNSHINRVGFVEFRQTAYHLPDGVIDSVSVNWSDESGLTETITFTGEYDAIVRDPLNITPNIYRVYKDIPISSKISLEQIEKNFYDFKMMVESSLGNGNIDRIANEPNSFARKDPKGMVKVITSGSINQDTLVAKMVADYLEPGFDIQAGSVLILGD